MSSLKPIKSLAPRICPQCEAELSFAVLEDRITCRQCGYSLRKEDGRPLTPAETIPKPEQPQTEPRQPLQASYRITHIGSVTTWARAAYDTGQDCIRRQDWEGAISAFKRAIDSQEDFVDPHLWIARIVEDPELKRDYLSTVIAHQPNHPEAIRELMILNGSLSAAEANLNEYTMPEVKEAGGAVDAKTKNLRCPRCGSPGMMTDEITGLAVCGSCGYADDSPRKQAVGEVNLTMALLHRRSQPVQWVIGERLLRCNSCGAERTIPAHKLSETCPFCGSNHVIQRDVLGSFQQPDGLIPFTIKREDAGERIKERLGGWAERIKGFFDSNKVARATLEGMFLPFWVFDTVVEVRKTIMRDTGGGRDTRRVVPTNLYETFTIAEMANNIHICGVTYPPPLLTGRLGSYNLDTILPYEPELLATYPAELYSMDFDKASLEARAAISRAMREKHTTSEGANTQVNVSSSVQQMSFQLLLMPVWVGTLFEADGDVRSVLVNGQDGRVVLGKARKPGKK